MKFEIKAMFSQALLFTAELAVKFEKEPSSVQLGEAVKQAIAAKANLRSADLRSADLRSANLRSADLRSANLRSANLYGADLYGADLYGADLRSANLRSADLRSADLRSANLRSADLRSADLRSANLRSANLYGADLGSANLYGADLGEGKKLVGDHPIIQLGPLAEVGEYLIAFLTESGPFVRFYGFEGSLPEFKNHVRQNYAQKKSAVVYAAAIQMIEAHDFAFTPEKIYISQRKSS